MKATFDIFALPDGELRKEMDPHESRRAIVTTEGGDLSTCKALARWKAKRAFRGFRIIARLRETHGSFA